MYKCSLCGYLFVDDGFSLQQHQREFHRETVSWTEDAASTINLWTPNRHENEGEKEVEKEGNKLPEGQGKRDKIRPRHDLIPVEFLDEIASIFEEGLEPRPGLPEGYGDSWKNGGELFLRDCLNHASNHLHLYMNGDRTENHLAKVAWNALVVKWFRPAQSVMWHQSSGEKIK